MSALPTIHAHAGEVVIAEPGDYETVTGGGTIVFNRGASHLANFTMDEGGAVVAESKDDGETVVHVGFLNHTMKSSKDGRDTTICRLENKGPWLHPAGLAMINRAISPIIDSILD